MKKLEEVKEEYKEYETQSTFVNTLEDFIAFLDVGIDESDVGVSDFTTEIHENKKWQVAAFFRNMFPFIFEEEDISFYDYDNELLLQGVALAGNQRTYFETMKNIATEENYKELLRLADFSTDYYNNHISYIETQRDVLEMNFKGYNMCNSKYKDKRQMFHEFFMEKINELTPHKVVEKVKQI